MLPKLSSSSSFNSYFSCNFFDSENEIPMARGSLDVDAEYTEAFHTNSFLNIWAEAHEHPSPAPSPRNNQPDKSPLPNVLLRPTHPPRRTRIRRRPRPSRLPRRHLPILLGISVLNNYLPGLASGGNISAADLSAYIDLGNPLSSKNLAPFHRTHSLYPALLTRLTAERRRLRRRARAVRVAKNAAGLVVLTAVGTAAVAAVVILTHAAVVVVAAAAAVPVVATSYRRRWQRWTDVKWMEMEGRKVDAAARGAYILGRDMDTVSRMVRRVQDEVEHRRDVVRLVLRSGEEEMVREVVREMEVGEDVFQEQIEELEEHVYLCLLTINRSRRLVHG
ncbi:putative UPF0496 protein 2 [Phalaenopsis equestris]|uniref:putative UPF0496 protein 2 n=1 Tax=Phalaenopsis equestris TaxID=78828 RepID=UPI0009E3F2AB|nr:putative UPF0496 protein 2 [Phalaenopsis equestris]